jgi:hypothetical protein
MLACSKDPQAPGSMHAVGQRKIHSVDTRIRQQGFIAVVASRNPVSLCKSPSFRTIATGHGCKHHARQTPHIAAKLSGDVGASKNTQAKWLIHPIFSVMNIDDGIMATNALG